MLKSTWHHCIESRGRALSFYRSHGVAMFWTHGEAGARIKFCPYCGAYLRADGTVGEAVQPRMLRVDADPSRAAY